MLAEGSQTIITFQHINPFTPRSDQFVISSYNIKTWLSKKVMRRRKSTKDCVFDFIPNSQ